MIEAKNLTKIFKVPTEEKSIFGAKKIDSAAVDDLSFSLKKGEVLSCLLYTSPSPRDLVISRMPSSA